MGWAPEAGRREGARVSDQVSAVWGEMAGSCGVDTRVTTSLIEFVPIFDFVACGPKMETVCGEL